MVAGRASKPELLYLSPVAPSLTGNGLAMRAGAVLEALAESYSVSLLVVALYPPRVRRVADVFAKLCRRTAIVSPRRRPFPLLPGWFDPLAAWRKLHLDVVHVFRLAMEPYARSFLNSRAGSALAHLDLDDVESTTHGRIAARRRANGDDVAARSEEFLAAAYERAEHEAFARFDRIYVCSDEDRTQLRGRTSAELAVLPNTVRLPISATRGSAGDNASLLFVGNLGYYPNDDAARYLCAEIVPRIRELWRGPLQVDIVGPGAGGQLLAVAAASGVRAAGWVPDLEPWYRDAAVVVVPIHAGGGTRIKILEAFSHRRPVVATPMAIEGIDARHEEHVLIGATADELARHAVCLMTDPALRERLASNAWALVQRCYSIEALKRTVASSLPPALRS